MKKSFLYFICAVSAMGGLLFGYDWVVIGGAKPFYELFFGITESPVLQGVAMSTALIGCLAGAMVAGAAADRFGRKPLLTTAAVLFTVSAVATGLFNDFTLFNIARFIGGISLVADVHCRGEPVGHSWPHGEPEPDDDSAGHTGCTDSEHAIGAGHKRG